LRRRNTKTPALIGRVRFIGLKSGRIEQMKSRLISPGAAPEARNGGGATHPRSGRKSCGALTQVLLKPSLSA
jgi:hypothetical protein